MGPHKRPRKTPGPDSQSSADEARAGPSGIQKRPRTGAGGLGQDPEGSTTRGGDPSASGSPVGGAATSDTAPGVGTARQNKMAGDETGGC